MKSGDEGESLCDFHSCTNYLTVHLIASTQKYAQWTQYLIGSHTPTHTTHSTYLGRHVFVRGRGVSIVGAPLNLANGDVNIESAAPALAIALHADLAAVQFYDGVRDCEESG